MKALARLPLLALLLALSLAGCAREGAAGPGPLSDTPWPADVAVSSSAMRRDGTHVLILSIARDPAAADAAISDALAQAGWVTLDRDVEGGFFGRSLGRAGQRLDVVVEPTGAESARAKLTLGRSP